METGAFPSGGQHRDTLTRVGFTVKIDKHVYTSLSQDKQDAEQKDSHQTKDT